MRPTLLDLHIARWMEKLSSVTALESVLDVMAHPLAWAPVLAGLTFYIARRGGRQMWALLLSGAVLTIGAQLLVGTVLEGLLGREAPDGLSVAGYLSANVFNAFCLATLIGRAHRELRTLVRAMAWILAFSQLFTAAHWFLDVFLAALSGSLVGFIVYQSQAKVAGFLATPAAPNPSAKRPVSKSVSVAQKTRWPAQDPFSKR